MPSFRMRKSRFRGADQARLRGDDGAAQAPSPAVPVISSIVIVAPPRSESVILKVDTTPVVAPDASPQTPKVGIVVKR